MRSKIILILICFFMVISLPVLAEEKSEPFRTAVMPLKNETGDSSLNWLSIGLQDAVTTNLFYLKTFEPLLLLHLDFLENLEKMSPKDMIAYAQKKGIQQVWKGRYRSTGTEISVEFSVISVESGEVLCQHVTTSELNLLLEEEAKAILAICEKLDVNVNEDEKWRVLSLKTNSPKAWQLHAEGLAFLKSYWHNGKKNFAEKAHALLKEALSYDENYAEAWNNLGWLFLSKYDEKEAFNTFDQALTMKPALIHQTMGTAKAYERAFDNEASVDFSLELSCDAFVLFKLLQKFLRREEALSIGIKLLEKGHESYWTDTAELLGQIGDKSAVPALIKALKNDNFEINYSAAKALVKIGDAAVPPLIEALKDSSEEVRAHTAWVLGEIGNRSAVSFLEDLVKDKSDLVREYTVGALGKIGDKSAVPVMIEALKDNASNVRVIAAYDLGKIGGKEMIPILEKILSDDSEIVRLRAAQALAELGDKKSVPILIALLKNKNPGIRARAASWLGLVADKTALPALLETLKDKDEVVRENSAYALRQIKDKLAVPHLIFALKDNSKKVRKWAIWALEEIGDIRAIPPLIEMWNDNDLAYSVTSALNAIGRNNPEALLNQLKNENLKSREKLAFILVDIGKHEDESVFQALMKMLKGSDKVLKKKAIKAFEEMEEKKAVPALIEELNSKDKDVYRSAEDALKRICEDDLTPLLEAFQEPTVKYRGKIARLLAQTGKYQGKVILPVLINSLKDADNAVKKDIMLAMGRFNDENEKRQVVPILIHALDDKDFDIRAYAAVALRGLSYDYSFVDLKEAIEIKDPEVRRRAVQLLGDSNKYYEKYLDLTPVNLLIGKLQTEKNPEVKAEAAEALGDIGNKRSIQVLKQVLSDPSPDVRFAAAVALGKMNDKSGLPILFKKLRSDDEWTRWKVLNAFAEIKEKSVVDELTRMLIIENDDDLRDDIAKALSEIGDQKAIQPLIKVLGSKDVKVSKAAAEALGEIVDRSAVLPLVEVLDSKDGQLCWQAAHALGEIGDEAAVPGLIKEVIKNVKEKGSISREAKEMVNAVLMIEYGTDSLNPIDFLNYPHMRKELTRPLHGTIQSKKYKDSINYLCGVLKEKELLPRRMAVKLLGIIGGTEVTPTLINALRDPNKEIQNEARDALILVLIKDKRTVAALITALKEDREPKVRAFAANLLKEIADKAAVPVLLKSLKDNKNELIRVYSVEALGKIGDETAVDDLMKLLDDENFIIRKSAVDALGKIGVKTAQDALLKTIKDPHPEVRKAAVEALGNIGTQKALPTLIESLNDEDRDIRLKAAYALRQFSNEKAVSALIDILKKESEDKEVLHITAESLGEIGDKGAIQTLKKALKNQSYQVRQSAVKALGKIGNSTCVKDLIKILESDSDKWVRSYAAHALGKIGGKEAIEALIKAIKIDNKTFILETINTKSRLFWDFEIIGDYREQAARALKTLEGTDREMVLSELMEILKYGDLDTKDRVFSVILEFADETMVDDLRNLLDNDNPMIRAAFSLILATFEVKRIISDIAKLLKDENEMVRVMAAAGLGLLGNTKGESLITEYIRNYKDIDLKDSDKSAQFILVVFSLYKLDKHKALPILRELLHHDQEEIRRFAINYLGEAAESQDVNTLAEALLDQDEYNRAAAVEALEKIKDPAVVKKLVKLLSDPSDIVREKTVIALGNIGDKSVAPDLKNMLEDDSEYVRISTAKALGNIGDKSAIPGLIKALNDSNKHVRKRAAEALIKLGEVSSIYKTFSKTCDITLFNFIRKNIFFEINEENLLIASSDSFIQACGYYLMALKAREENRFKSQLNYANKAFNLIDPEKDTAVAILILWRKAEAELILKKAGDLIKTVENTENLLQFLSNKEKKDFEELFVEYTLYLKGDALISNKKEKMAIGVFESALDMLNRRIKNDDMEEQSRNLLPTIQSRNYVAHEIDTGGEGVIAAQFARGFQPSNIIEMRAEEERLLWWARRQIGDNKIKEAQEAFEELNLKRNKYINRRMELKMANPEKMEHIKAFKEKNKEIETLAKQIDSLKKERDKEKSGSKEEKKLSQQIKKLSIERRERNSEINKYYTELQRIYPEVALILRTTPFQLKLIREHLPASTAILQYLLLPDNRLAVFFVSGSFFEVIKININHDELQKKTDSFRLALKKSKSSNRGLRIVMGSKKLDYETLRNDLYDILIKPIDDEGLLKGIKVLGIAPNSFLHYLPFGVLSENSTGCLLDRFDIFYINSTSVLYVAMDKGKQVNLNNGILAFGNPDNSLRHAEKEVNEISAFFDKKLIYKKRQATKENLMNHVNNISILHFATHGKFNTYDSTNSYLLMADGKLTVKDIWGLPLDHVAFTTLSACETGVGEILSGDDIISLENAFIFAGSPSVISTLWEVDDKSTTELMVLFYRYQQEGMTKVEALKKAQIEIRLKYPHPYYWAGFTLRGDWR